MNLYRGKRILVLEPLVELGKNSEQAHFDIGKTAGKICDALFLTNDNYINSIRKGVKSSGRSISVTVASPFKISKFISQNCKRDDVIIFEGKEAQLAIKAVQVEMIY